MKKFIIVLTLLTAIIVLVTPLLIGLIAARFYPDLVATASTNDPDLNIESGEFHRGWFSSRATHRIGLKAPAVTDWLAAFDVSPADFEFDDELRHGLFPFGAKSLAPVILAGGGGLRQTNGQMAGELHYVVPFDGEPEISLALEPINAEGPQGYFRTSGGSLTFSANRELTDINVQWSQKALALLGPGADIDLMGAALDLDWDDGEGQLTGSVQGLRRGDLRLGNFEFDGRVVRVDKWIEIRGTFQDANFGLGEDDYGALTGEFAITRLEARGLDAVGRRLTAPAASPEAKQAAILGELISQAPILLAKQPRVELSNLTLKGGLGNASASGTVSLLPPSTDALRNPMQLIQFLEADLKADVPQAMAQSLMRYRVDTRTGNRLQGAELDQATDVALQRLRGEGLFVLRDEVYQMRASRKDGVTTINGQALALPNG